MSNPRTQSGISIKTLMIAASGSAAAAIIVPLFWKPGTVVAAAMTPVIVTIVSELLKRPAEAVTAVRPRRRGEPEEFDPLAPPPPGDLASLPRHSEVRRSVHGRDRLLSPRQWRLALATAGAAFVLAVTAVTASELLAGQPVTADGGRTTFLGGSSGDEDADSDEDADRKQRDSGKRSTGDGQERTPRPTATPTPSPSATVTPAPTATPSPTTPAPTVTPEADVPRPEQTPPPADLAP